MYGHLKSTRRHHHYYQHTYLLLLLVNHILHLPRHSSSAFCNLIAGFPRIGVDASAAVGLVAPEQVVSERVDILSCVFAGILRHNYVRLGDSQDLVVDSALRQRF